MANHRFFNKEFVASWYLRNICPINSTPSLFRIRWWCHNIDQHPCQHRHKVFGLECQGVSYIRPHQPENSLSAEIAAKPFITNTSSLPLLKDTAKGKGTASPISRISLNHVLRRALLSNIIVSEMLGTCGPITGFLCSFLSSSIYSISRISLQINAGYCYQELSRSPRSKKGPRCHQESIPPIDHLIASCYY